MAKRNGYTTAGQRNEHTLIVERALGHPLPPGAHIHHIDGVRSNNHPDNLVVCPNAEYHHLLHTRQRAFAACGNYSWRKCKYCKKYDAPENLKINKFACGTSAVYHAACHAAYVHPFVHKWYHQKKAKQCV